MRSRRPGAFSLTELLVVIAILLILMSILLVGADELWTSAESLRCQNNLEKLGHACQMWSNVHDGQELPAVGTEAGRTVLWYKALAPYLSATGTFGEAQRALNCPLVLGESAIAGSSPEDWGGGPDVLFAYDRYRVWFDFVGIVEDLRSAGWPGSIHMVERHPVEGGPFTSIAGMIQDYGIFTYIDAWWGKYFTAEELNALKEFGQESRGIFVSADHYDVFTQVNNQLADYCGWGLYNLANIDRTGTFEPVSDHPIVSGVTMFRGYNSEGRIEIPSDPAKQNPHARLVVFSPLHSGPPPDALVGTLDDGKIRLVMETPWTKFASPGWYYGGDVKPSHFRYVQNIYKWLLERSAGGHEISYGYNNQVAALHPHKGHRLPRPANPSQVIRILDYEEYLADHDGLPDPASDDPEYYIAPRHGGRANVLFMDCTVRSLTPEAIRADNWALWSAGR